MVVGVNGVGKTTTIGKLCGHFKEQNKNVLLVAGDTFRAAAAEQRARLSAHRQHEDQKRLLRGARGRQLQARHDAHGRGRPGAAGGGRGLLDSLLLRKRRV